MFTLKVQDKFCAAHQLVGYPGDCANLHGHTWKVEVVLEGEHIDNLNMLIDFRDVKWIISMALEPLDHSNLNEVLEEDLPTAEFVACYIHTAVTHLLKELELLDYVSLREVTVWESDNACITYSEEE